MTSPTSLNSTGNDLQLNYPWIDILLFEKLIRKDYKNNETITVEQFSLEPALSKGENFLSQMIRAKVDYKINNSVTNQISFVIKAQLVNAPESLRLNELFLREIAVFEHIIPLAEELLRRIGDNTKFSAKCYEANSEKYFLVFEDLATRGYRNANRQIGLTMENFRAAFSILAKWHATTAILMETKSHIMSPFVNVFRTTFFEKLVRSIIKTVAQFTEECLPAYDKVTRKLEVLSEEIFAKMQKAMERNPNEFNCLCHIDLWTNNIMFDESIPSSIKSLLIDFQMVYAGSPILDLCYSLFSSSDLSMRAEHFDSLICYYHDQLSSTLTKLGYEKEIPTLEMLQNEMIKRGIYGVPLGIFETAARYFEKKEDIDMDWFVSESDDGKKFRLNLFKNPKCRDKVLFLLNYFDSKGYFDI